MASLRDHLLNENEKTFCLSKAMKSEKKENARKSKIFCVWEGSAYVFLKNDTKINDWAQNVLSSLSPHTKNYYVNLVHDLSCQEALCSSVVVQATSKTQGWSLNCYGGSESFFNCPTLAANHLSL